MKTLAEVKKIARDYFDQLEHCTVDEITAVLDTFMATDYSWEVSYPFLDGEGTANIANTFWKPIKETLVRMQRRQDIFMAGEDINTGKTWVMSMGQFMGLFDKEILGIRRTRKMQHLQYAEYLCLDNDGKITHTALFIDLIGFMKEAGQYPLMEETGHYFVYSGPRDHNGLLFDDQDPEEGKRSMATVEKMGAELCSINGTHEHPRKMLEGSWSEDMIWYGPCGIGASYTIDRYQEQHQIPFREGLRDLSANELFAYFAEGNFVCFYGSMEVTPIKGWLGLPATEKSTHLRGDIDIYYVKDGKILENWCFIDIPNYLHLQGVEIFERTESINNSKK